jgi:hypothetical protein
MKTRRPISVRVISGPPHTFGWLRRPELDSTYPDNNVWEAPDGSLYLHKKGAAPLIIEKVIEKD